MTEKKYKIQLTKRFEKDVKRCKKRGFPMEKLKEVVRLLEENGVLPQSYKSHKLSGKYDNLWECHLMPDWLLVWQQNDNEFIMLLISTGTHSDLF